MTDSRRIRVLVLALVAGAGVRLLLALTTIGSSDVQFLLFFANVVAKHGVAGAYAFGEAVNHPPLSLLLIAGYDRIASILGLEYPQLFRIVQTLADAVTAWAIFRLEHPLSRWVAAAYLLSPAAMFITGFHCNTDPTMMMLIVLAVLAARRRQSFLAGVLLAAAFGIKIVAIFAAPLLFLEAAQRRWRFAAGFGLAAAVLFLPTAVLNPQMLRNVFGYSGWAAAWGISGIARTIHARTAGPADATVWLWLSDGYFHYGKYVVLAALAAFYLLIARAGSVDLLKSVPAVFLILLVVAPAFGVQYLLWCLPRLPFAVPRGLYVATSAIFSIYLFFVYTIWSDGFPWWFADATAPHPMKWMLTDAGHVVWVWLVVVTVWALQSVVRSAGRGGGSEEVLSEV